MTLYPSSNEWGIPDLLADLQPTRVETPVIPWGSVARGTRMPGTWHLYRDDYKLSGVLNRPMSLVATQCYAACEANITTYLQSARWEAIAAVGRKRHAARIWQEHGIRVFVDLNVPLTRWPEIFMAGVPRGWSAFSTRAYANDLDVLRQEYEFAEAWAGKKPLLAVIGGGRAAEDFCRELPGAVWVDDSWRRRAVG